MSKTPTASNLSDLCYGAGGVQMGTDGDIAQASVGEHVHDSRCGYVRTSPTRVELRHVDGCGCCYEPRETVRVRVREVRRQYGQDITTAGISRELGERLDCAAIRGKARDAATLIAGFDPVVRPYLTAVV